MDFSNKIVLVTGASRGIGKAIAIKFAEKGANVIVNYRNNMVEANDTLGKMKSGKHLLAKADISDPIQLSELFETIILKYGRLDILVNNAGIAISHPIDQISFEAWQHSWKSIMDTNLTAIANTCYLAAQQMIKQKSGRIVNVSSRGAFRGEPDQPAYGASKAGLNSLSQSLAKQLGPHNIFVTAVAPGFVETDMATDFISKEEWQAVENQSPLSRMAKPEEIADAVLYLASDQSAFTTGAILDINGASYLRT